MPEGVDPTPLGAHRVPVPQDAPERPHVRHALEVHCCRYPRPAARDARVGFHDGLRVGEHAAAGRAPQAHERVFFLHHSGVMVTNTVRDVCPAVAAATRGRAPPRSRSADAPRRWARRRGLQTRSPPLSCQGTATSRAARRCSCFRPLDAKEGYEGVTVGCSFCVNCCKPRGFALDVAVGAPKGRACSMLPCPPEAARVEEQPVGAAARRGGVRSTL